MKIAVIWARFGPYHLARLRGAAEVGASHGVSIVGIEVAQSDSIYDWDVVNDDGALERRTLFPRRYESLRKAEISEAIVAVLDAIRPEVVAINGWSVIEARTAISWCSSRRVRSIVMSESMLNDAARVWWKEYLKGRIVRRCDAALVGGTPHAEYLRKLGFKGEIFIGYDVVDNDYFARETAKVLTQAAHLRAVAGLPRRYFFACTRFITRKNIDGLFRAYAKYRREIGEEAWGLVVAGSGEEQATYRRLEQQLGLQGVIWPGFLQYDQLPLYYGLATAFVHPAVREPWGLVVNEAIASGLPVLLSRNVGARYELLREGANGFSFDPRDDVELTARMLDISRMTPTALAAMGEASRRIAGEWTPSRFGRMLLGAAGITVKDHMASDSE